MHVYSVCNMNKHRFADIQSADYHLSCGHLPEEKKQFLLASNQQKSRCSHDPLLLVECGGVL